MATPSPEVSQCATTSGTEYTMQTNLTHYEDITQLEDDILCFLPTVSDIDVFGCEVDLIELDAQLPLPEAFHTALLQQKKLQIVVRPCMVDTPSGNSKQMIERATLKPYESLSIHAEKLLTEPFTQHLCFDMWKLQQACSTQALRPPGLSAAAESQAPPSVPGLEDGAFQGCCVLREVVAPGCVQYFFLHGYGRYVCREAQVTESNSDRGYVR